MSSELIEPETERLRLRQWREEDYEPFAALNADPQVMEFFPSPLERAASDAMVDRCRDLIARRSWGFWAVEEHATGDFVGLTGLHIPTADLPFSPCVEIGWRLARRFWGRGYASEGARAALRVGFEQLGFDEIVSFTALPNKRSRAVMERIGMHDAGTIFEHPNVPFGHQMRSHCLYRLTRAEWRA